MSGHDKQNFDFKSATTIGGVEISCGDDGCSEFDVLLNLVLVLMMDQSPFLLPSELRDHVSMFMMNS